MGTRSTAGRAHVGCSGWSYKDWRGDVYPADAPARRWFELYAQRFDTVALNATFYRLPEASTVERWAAQAPGDFVYAAKVGQFGTHRMKLRDPGPWMEKHLDRIRRLGHHLGPNLFQLPPRWKRDTTRLADLLDVLPDDVRWALEVREPSWLHDDVLSLLEKHGVALCIHELLADHSWERTTDWTYVRFHGPNAIEAPYQGAYTGRRLWRVADRLGEWRDAGADVFAYFNNDWNANAVRDATWLRDRLTTGEG